MTRRRYFEASEGGCWSGVDRVEGEDEAGVSAMSVDAMNRRYRFLDVVFFGRDVR